MHSTTRTSVGSVPVELTVPTAGVALVLFPRVAPTTDAIGEKRGRVSGVVCASLPLLAHRRTRAHQVRGRVGVEAVVGGGEKQPSARVERLLGQIVQKVLEEASPVHPRLRQPVLVHKLDAHRALELRPDVVELRKAILQQAVAPHLQTVAQTVT
eukprot:544694-Pyramimonas_sp.AAC.2